MAEIHRLSGLARPLKSSNTTAVCRDSPALSARPVVVLAAPAHCGRRRCRRGAAAPKIASRSKSRARLLHLAAAWLLREPRRAMASSAGRGVRGRWWRTRRPGRRPKPLGAHGGAAYRRRLAPGPCSGRKPAMARRPKRHVPWRAAPIVVGVYMSRRRQARSARMLFIVVFLLLLFCVACERATWWHREHLSHR